MFSSSFLVNGEVCGDYYFLFYSPFPHIIHTNTNDQSQRKHRRVDWWVTINHRRVVAAAPLREKGGRRREEINKKGGVALCCQMVAQILIMLVICQAYQ